LEEGKREKGKGRRGKERKGEGGSRLALHFSASLKNHLEKSESKSKYQILLHFCKMWFVIGNF